MTVTVRIQSWYKEEDWSIAPKRGVKKGDHGCFEVSSRWAGPSLCPTGTIAESLGPSRTGPGKPIDGENLRIQSERDSGNGADCGVSKKPRCFRP